MPVLVGNRNVSKANDFRQDACHLLPTAYAILSEMLNFFVRLGLSGFLSILAVSGQATNTQPASPPLPPTTVPGPAPAPIGPNGISVGRPKIFDNRSLTLMLENLSETLRGMQGQFLASASINTAQTNVQGMRASDVSTSVTATTLPIPSQKQEVITNAGLVDSAGKPLPDTTKTTTTMDRAAIPSTPPQLDSFVGSQTGFNPTLGANAADLLSDQVNLTYQILNLRMILGLCAGM
ncbi:MAG: hypothetical protein FJW30_26265 [Acidobacteria bacterium]|nr:hypothetical protein [Acidobacteriota bacterium]